MAAFRTLLRRFCERPSIVEDERELKVFREREDGTLECAWRAWMRAERGLARRHPRVGLAWLSEARRVAVEDPLLQAELLSSEARCWTWLDEPRNAMGPARLSWEGWMRVTERASPAFVGPSARALLAVLSEPDPAPPLSDDELVAAWLQDRFALEMDRAPRRLLKLYADFRDLEAARELSDQYLGMIERGARGPLAKLSGIASAHHLLTLGDVYDRCDEQAQALAVFQRGLSKLADAAESDEVVSLRAQLQFNAANQLAHLGRLEEALAAFEAAREDLVRVGSEEAVLRARYATAFTRYLLGENAGIEAELVELAEAYERVLRGAATGPAQIAYWQMVNKVYRLWAKLSAQALDTADPRATALFFHQLFALKEYEAKLTDIWRKVADQPEAELHSEITVMVDRLDQRSDASLLVIEQAHEALIVAALGVGPGPWNTRVSVQVIEGESTRPITDLIRLQRRAVHDLVDGRIARDAPADQYFLEVCASAWTAFDEPVRRRIESAETVLVTIDNQTELDQLPVELLHDGQTFLGLRRNVVRVPSLNELNLLLCENRTNASPTGAALIVRAEGELPVADVEVATVAERLRGRGLAVEVERGPSPETLLTRLGAGLDVFHYVGHGLADEIGEVLPLGPGAALRAQELEYVGPAPAPVTLLSGCMTGRGRQLRTGQLQGFVTALLHRGSPGVIAAKYLVGEEFAPEFADLLYDSWRDASLPAAVRAVREILAGDQYHPAVWCSYVVFGAPDVPAPAPHARDTRTWPSAVLRFLATGSDRHLAHARDLLDGDSRLSPENRRIIARDLAALAGGDRAYFHSGIMKEGRGLGAFSEAMLASNLVRAFGLLRHGEVQEQHKEGLIHHVLEIQRILGDDYLLVAAAVAMREHTLLHLHTGKNVMYTARRRIRWLSADREELAEAASALESTGEAK